MKYYEEMGSKWVLSVHQSVRTWRSTNTPPKTNATALAPFFKKMPAQIPHTEPKVSSYTLIAEDGGGGSDDLGWSARGESAA